MKATTIIAWGFCIFHVVSAANAADQVPASISALASDKESKPFRDVANQIEKGWNDESLASQFDPPAEEAKLRTYLQQFKSGSQMILLSILVVDQKDAPPMVKIVATPGNAPVAAVLTALGKSGIHGDKSFHLLVSLEGKELKAKELSHTELLPILESANRKSSEQQDKAEEIQPKSNGNTVPEITPEAAYQRMEQAKEQAKQSSR